MVKLYIWWLNRTLKTVSTFDAKVSIKTKKYVDAGYLIGFIKSVITEGWNATNYTSLAVWIT